MKRAMQVIAVTVIVAFIVLQFFQIDKTAPPVNKNETLEAAVAVPPDVSEIIVRSCNDCHSYTTVYPWYVNIQPVGWFMKNHIDEGRQRMNFSIFNTYSAQKKVKKLEDICEQVQSREMPLPSYLWIHSGSVLSESDVKALCDWSNQVKAKIVVE